MKIYTVTKLIFSCSDCPNYFWDRDENAFKCNATGKEIETIFIPDWCQLEEKE